MSTLLWPVVPDVAECHVWMHIVVQGEQFRVVRSEVHEQSRVQDGWEPIAHLVHIVVVVTVEPHLHQVHHLSLTHHVL